MYEKDASVTYLGGNNERRRYLTSNGHGHNFGVSSPAAKLGTGLFRSVTVRQINHSSNQTQRRLSSIGVSTRVHSHRLRLFTHPHK